MDGIATYRELGCIKPFRAVRQTSSAASSVKQQSGIAIDKAHRQCCGVAILRLIADRNPLSHQTSYSYRKTSAGAIRVAMRAGYKVDRKLIKIAAALIQMPCTQ